MDNHKSNKSTMYIIGFTLLIAIIIVIFIITRMDNNDTDNPNTPAQQASVLNNTPDVTRGANDATIAAEISFREVDFSLSKDQVIDKEKKMEDTLDNPDIATASDGYEYITFQSNPENLLNYNGFTISTTGTTCLTYVFHNDNMEEVRLQFGSIDHDTINGLLNNITSQYGENTFYRSTNGVESYWWKAKEQWLILTTDSVGTTLFFRKN